MYKLLPLVALLALFAIAGPSTALADTLENFVLVPCYGLSVPYRGPVPSGCFAWYYHSDMGTADWTLAEIFTLSPSIPAGSPVTGVNLLGECGGDILSGVCDPHANVSISLVLLNDDATRVIRRVGGADVPVTRWPAVGSGGPFGGGCGNFFSCAGNVFVPFSPQPVLYPGERYALAISNDFDGNFILGNQLALNVGTPTIGGVPLLGNVVYGSPATAPTPELDSLVLFGTGLSGIAAYGLRRWRASRSN